MLNFYKRMPVFTLLFFNLSAAVELYAQVPLTQKSSADISNKLSLAGNWRVLLDPMDEGKKAMWFSKDIDTIRIEKSLAERFIKYHGAITLPGSLEQGGYGEAIGQENFSLFEHKLPGPLARLNRTRRYTGKAWYQRSIVVPESWKGSQLSVSMERCMWNTELWVDGASFGSQSSLLSPHDYQLGQLTPGRHTISICVDNARIFNIGEWSHAYSDEVQTIWNGIIGRMEMSAHKSMAVESINVYTNPDLKQFEVHVKAHNSLDKEVNANIELRISGSKSKDIIYSINLQPHLKSGDTTLKVVVPIAKGFKLWDEFHPNLYTVQVSLAAKNIRCVSTQLFGLRSFETRGGNFVINKQPVFLRGTHDEGAFPLTGYPSTDKKDWIRIMGIIKSYGLNHVRFHSFTPPDAAFAAADELGIYLQCELPLFNINAPPIGKDAARDQFLKDELKRILITYGNHPSFCLMSMGNELTGDYGILDRLVVYGKAIDNKRHLYTRTTNPEAGGALKPGQYDQYLALHAGLENGKRIMKRGEDVFDRSVPQSSSDYRNALSYLTIPCISHEIGQWCVYPDYNQIKDYTGILRPLNLEWMRQSMQQKGLLPLNQAFSAASGKFAMLLYREEIERSLRTPNYGGFQLLDLHDYPGQGTALVGILDVFWKSKGIISPAEFRHFCSPVVPLLRLEKYVWLNTDTIKSVVDFANYSMENITLKPYYVVLDQQKKIIGQGQLQNKPILSGGLTRVGAVHYSLTGVKKAQQLTIQIRTSNATIVNEWNIWVYPSDQSVSVTGLSVTRRLDAAAMKRLEDGKTVVLLHPELKQAQAVRFPTPFWNVLLFSAQPKTYGIYCNPKNPVFNHFPTADHSEWQWWNLTHADGKTDSFSNGAMVLDELPQELNPLVYVIDDPTLNNKLALLFECKVKKGKLIVCSLDLQGRLKQDIVAKQLYKSIMMYAQSAAFNPPVTLTKAQLDLILK